MKVYFFTKSLSAGGAETQSTIIASGLKARGYDVEFIVYSKDKANAKNLKRLEDAGILIHELFWKRSGDLLKMYRLFRGNRGGAIFAFTSFPNFIGCCVAKIAGLRRIYAGVRSENLPGLHMKMERFLNNFIVDKTVFNSHRGREKFIACGFNPNKCITISNAIESIDDAGKHGIPTQMRIVTVGRFIESKDYYSWLKVVAKVHSKCRNVKAIIIGYGELVNRIREWIAELRLSAVVEIKQGNGGIDISTELASSDIYLTTTLREGCCNAILEAMRAGLPVVATDAGDNGYMVRNGVNGYVTELKDVDRLAQYVCELLSDNEKRDAFGCASRKIVAEEYSPEVVFRKYEELLG